MSSKVTTIDGTRHFAYRRRLPAAPSAAFTATEPFAQKRGSLPVGNNSPSRYVLRWIRKAARR
jgi:hypothetical protein